MDERPVRADVVLNAATLYIPGRHAFRDAERMPMSREAPVMSEVMASSQKPPKLLFASPEKQLPATASMEHGVRRRPQLRE